MKKILISSLFLSGLIVVLCIENYSPSRYYLPAVSYPRIPEVENPTDFEDFLVN